MNNRVMYSLAKTLTTVLVIMGSDFNYNLVSSTNNLETLQQREWQGKNYCQ